MKNDYKMITVNEYLNVLDGEKSFDVKEVETMISIEKYLSEVENDRRNEAIIGEMLN